MQILHRFFLPWPTRFGLSVLRVIFFSFPLFSAVHSHASPSKTDLLCEDLFLDYGLSSRFAQMHLSVVLDYVHSQHYEVAESLMKGRPTEFTVSPFSRKIFLSPKSLQHILFGEFRIEKALQPHLNSSGTLRSEQTDSIVLKGGLHSFQGLKIFESLRELTKTPLDMYIVNEDLYTSKERDTRAVVFNQKGVHEVSLPRIGLYRFPTTRSLAVGFPRQSIAHQVFLDQFSNGSIHIKNRAEIERSPELQKISTIYGYFRQNFTKLLFPEEMSLEVITRLLYHTLQSDKTVWSKKSDGLEGKIKVVLPNSQELTAKVVIDPQGNIKSFYPVEDFLQPFQYLSQNTHSEDTDKSTLEAKVEDFATNVAMIKLFFSRPTFLEKLGRKEQVDHLSRSILIMLSDSIRENFEKLQSDSTKGMTSIPKNIRKELSKLSNKLLKSYPHGILPQKVILELSVWLRQNLGYTTMIPDEYAQMLTTRMLQEIDSRHWEQP